MKYIASWSGGKDSTAQIILAHEKNIKIDYIIFSEVMFDKNISGELPEHIEFIKKNIPIFEVWGYPVKILHSNKTYLDLFYHMPTRGKRANTGLRSGFPMAGKCQINRECKINPINNFLKTIDENYIQYIGIAVDEPKRLQRLDNNKISLLSKYNYTEKMAYELCKKYNLLSPIYDFAPRGGGCWFCPNARDCELKYLRKNHRDLWNILLKLEKEPNLIGNIWNTLSKKVFIKKNYNFILKNNK